jgi:DNA-binding transcriptional LysR family regulator
MNSIHNKSTLASTVDMAIFNRIDINLYPLFITIFEQKSISKAAQILCITQSAASHALQRLRQHLQDDLFVRAGSKMLPTPFAEQIYPVIKNALIAIQSISVQKQNFDPSMVQTLKIAVHDEIEPIILPKLVEHFHQLNLAIQFSSIKLDRKNVVIDLATQQIDFVIDLEQNFGEKIQFEKLLQDQFVVCTQQPSMTKDIYLTSPHIGVSSRRTGVFVEDIYLNRKKLSRQIFLRCQHYSTALQILTQQSSVLLTIPKNILAHLQIAEGLNIFDVPVQLPNIDIGMYWHKDLQDNSRREFLRSEIYKIFT